MTLPDFEDRFAAKLNEASAVIGDLIRLRDEFTTGFDPRRAAGDEIEALRGGIEKVSTQLMALSLSLNALPEPPAVDLSGYATTQEVMQFIAEIPAPEVVSRLEIAAIIAAERQSWEAEAEKLYERCGEKLSALMTPLVTDQVASFKKDQLEYRDRFEYLAQKVDAFIGQANVVLTDKLNECSTGFEQIRGMFSQLVNDDAGRSDQFGVTLQQLEVWKEDTMKEINDTAALRSREIQEVLDRVDHARRALQAMPVREASATQADSPAILEHMEQWKAEALQEIHATAAQRARHIQEVLDRTDHARREILLMNASLVDAPSATNEVP